ncbi:MAG TPA: PASTA domain-containing protein [Acidimicrobiia bacterium]|nr:PASTA domain-containing protein [Acidimicrobiia bacterium]
MPVGRNVATPKALEVLEGASAAYGTGTVVHADALRTGEHALADLDVAFSGAAFSQGETAAAYINEVHRTVAKLVGDKLSYGRGTGLEIGLLSDPNPFIGQLSQAAAPASTDLIQKVVGPIGIPGVIRAELLRSQAQARATEHGCPLSNDAGYGLGSVLNLEVLGGLVSTNARPPYREVSQSNSTTRIIPSNGRLGLKSESRQTIAPVTFFNGSPFQFTVEVLGEWALRAIADGVEGKIHYGPLDVSPQTPVVRILDAKGKPIIQVTTQMLLGKKGLEITIPEIAEIVIGEDPRMIGDNASSDPIATPTQVAAAADVVRVKLLKGQLADVRVGHMEAGVTVPSGGVNCPGLIVNNEVDKPTVTPGDEFLYTIDITNPHDCILTGLKIVEKPTLAPGVKIQVVSSTPAGGQVAAGVVSSAVDALATFAVGPLGPDETKTVKIKVKIPLDSLPGLLKALAVADGVCPAEVKPPNDTDGPKTPGTPEAGDIPVRGADAVDGPTVGVCVVPLLKGKTPTEAKALLEAAGCTLGQVKDGGPGNPADKGKVVDQGPPAGNSVPLGAPVDITIGGPLCTVPSVAGKTPEEAKPILEAAGCELGKVTTGPTGNPEDAGKITTQTPPAGDKVPTGTKIDVVLVPGGDTTLVAASTNCSVPGLIGMTEAEARTKVEAAGCVLVTEPKNTSKAEDLGKVLTQEPGANTVVPRGSPVKVQLGVQVLGATETNSQQEAAPGLARTGGVAFGGLALWLLLGGLATRLTGSERIWRLARRCG